MIRNDASASGTTLQLSASDPNITIPATATIPAGATSQDVSFQIGAAFNPSHVFALTAQFGTESHTAYGTQALAGQNVGFATALQLTTTPVIVAGQTTPDYGLLIGSIDGYATQISISCQGLPVGASCQIAPDPASLPAGGVISVSLAVATQSGLAAGQYPFTVKLTDGTVTRTISAVFNVGDFAMSLSPAAQTLAATDFTSFTLNIQGINGYSQPIQITCSGLPPDTVCPFNTAAWPGANYFQIHTQNAPSGTYTFTLTGASNGITRAASAQLTVTTGTFTGSVSPSSATISVGGSKSFAVQVNSGGGFQGQVNLTCNAASGVTCQLSPAQVTLTSGGSATATLTIGVTTKPAIIPLSWETYRRTLRRSRPLVLLPLLFAISATWWWMIAGRRQRAFVAARAIAWPHRAIFFLLLFALLGISSCGGGATSGGGGGGGGGTVTVTNVTVQGTSGGTSVTLGSISVTIR